jgi:hypothetical protein
MARREMNIMDQVLNLAGNFDANVLAEDRVLVRNVMAALCAVHMRSVFASITIQKIARGYDICARVTDGVDFDFVGQDMHTIESVSPLRVLGCSIERRGSALTVRVRVLGCDQPVQLTESIVTCVKKRRRLLT